MRKEGWCWVRVCVQQLVLDNVSVCVGSRRSQPCCFFSFMPVVKTAACPPVETAEPTPVAIKRSVESKVLSLSFVQNSFLRRESANGGGSARRTC